MQSHLSDKARTRRISALASLPARDANVISLARRRANRDVVSMPTMFVSVRAPSAPLHLAA